MSKGKRTHRPDDDFVPVTVDEFFAMADDPRGRKLQLMGGEVVAMAPPSHVHARIVSNLFGLLRDRFRELGKPCVPVSDVGVMPDLDARHNVRVPDLLVTCSSAILGEQYVKDPILVVEVLSPRNAKRTRDGILAYALIPSVREIVLLDSRRISAELYRRNADGGWTNSHSGIIGRDARLVLNSAEMDVRLSDIYSGTSLVD